MIISKRSTTSKGNIEIFKSKVCSRCGIDKKLIEYSIGNSKHNRNSRCRECIKQYRKDTKEHIKERNKTYYIKNKEDIKEQNKTYYVKNKEDIKERNKTYYIKNKEDIKERNKTYYIKNKEDIKEQNKTYYVKNKEKVSNRCKRYYNTEKGKETKRRGEQKRRALKNNVSKYGNYNNSQWLECLVFFHYLDALTGLKMKVISVDHITPLSKGGLNLIYNIIPCENSINKSKNSSDLYKWYKQQDYYNLNRLLKVLYWRELQKVKMYMNK